MSTNKMRRKRRLPTKYIIRRIGCLVLLVAFITGIGMLAAGLMGSDETTIDSKTRTELHAPLEFAVSDTAVFKGQYQKTFDDIQEVQIVAAQSRGIEPLATNAEIDSVLALGKLVRVYNPSLYETEKADHPYLIHDAVCLLDTIASRYQARGHKAPLRLTGCLRTDEHVSKLMRRNVNSVKNSCHLYGTTFDISYRYLSDREKRDLAQVLYALQQARHCYVKYERKQPCFHITIR